jgi:hypothetical protein
MLERVFMGFLRRFLAANFIVIVMGALLALTAPSWLPVYAQDDEPTPTPSTRRTLIDVEFNGYEWWLIRWSDNEIVCRLVVDHEGRPTNFEIGQGCEEDIYFEWLETVDCPEAVGPGTTEECVGFYLHLAWSGAGTKKVEINLPLPTVELSLQGCTIEPPYNNRCQTLPSLILTGIEPLPNEVIIRLQGTINGQPFSCPGRQCAIPLQPTGIQGIFLEFWADSSFGDSSEHYTAQVRAMPWGDFADPEGDAQDEQSYYVDVISSQFQDGNQVSCTDVWQVFPDLTGPPPWLTSPKTAEGLNSNQGYYYLAGRLIRTGVVDATGCPDGGLTPTGTATTCGVQAAQPVLEGWQNQFNQQIFDVSRDTGIPAWLMKNIFSRESQFWPGLYENFQEAGLGQLTEDGADTVLLWNPDFFAQFCPLVLDKVVCSWGFGNLDEDTQALLRGALVTKVNAECPECPIGIDLDKAHFSIEVFAESLLGNCEQVAQIILNNTERTPGQVSSFVDLWKYTLVNYNAGPGCLGDAIERSWTENEKLNWELVSAQLDPVCQQSLRYIDDVTRYPAANPTPTPKVNVAERTPGPGEADEDFDFAPEPTETPDFPTLPTQTLEPTTGQTATETVTPTVTVTP